MGKEERLKTGLWNEEGGGDSDSVRRASEERGGAGLLRGSAPHPARGDARLDDGGNLAVRNEISGWEEAKGGGGRGGRLSLSEMEGEKEGLSMSLPSPLRSLCRYLAVRLCVCLSVFLCPSQTVCLTDCVALHPGLSPQRLQDGLNLD